MMKKINLNLRGKLLVVVVIGILITFSSIGALRVYQLKNSYADETVRSGNERVLLIAEGVANMIIAHDYGNIESVADRIVQLRDVQKINIFNQAGKLMVTRNRINFSPESIDLEHMGALFVAPVTFSGKTVGSVELIISKNHFDELIKKTYLDIVVALCLSSIFIGLLIYTTVAAFIVKPLLLLGNAANQLALGDFSAVLPSASKDELGNLVRAFSSMRESRRLNEAKLVAIFENAPDAFIQLDDNGVITNWNDNAANTFGYTKDEVIGKIFEFVMPDRNAELNPGYKRCYQKNKNYTVLGVIREFQGKRKDGSFFPLELRTSEVRFEGENAYLVSVRDITGRKLVEEEISQLHTELSQFKNTLDQTLECVFMFQLGTLRFTYVNEGAKRQIGYSETELLQMTPVDIKPLFTLEQFQQVLQPLIAGVLPALTFQTVHRHKDGHDIPVEIFLQLVRLDGQNPRFVAMVNDISERKESETKLLNAMNALLAANAAKSAFMSNISHEIRTPMNSIIGMSHLALKTHLNAKQHDYLTKIGYSAQHLLQLINNILDFSKNESNKVELEILDFELGTVFANISSQLTHSAASKSLRLKFDLDPVWSMPLRGDPLRLAQVLLNYASNAIKFTAKGEIMIRARMIEEGVNDFLMRFEVQDTGIGLSPEEIEKLFQPFHQANASITRKYGGTGLGLAISKQLVELMGGTVGVESQPDQGSTFWFTARLAKGGKLFVQLGATPLNLEVLKGVAILLVEDNLFNQQVAVEMLSDVVASVSIANNGQEAIDLLLKQRFDCVLMDVQMPVMDGLEATRQIRSNPALAVTHIIGLSANVGKEDQERCFAAGMDNFIRKPVFPELLYAAIAQCVAQAQRVQEPLRVAAESMPKQDQSTSKDHPGTIDLSAPSALIPDYPLDICASQNQLLVGRAEARHVGLKPDLRPNGLSGLISSDGVAVIDFSVLERIIGSDPAKIHKFTLKYLNSAQQGLDEIEEALRQEDMAALAALGHRNKSPARTVGATAYADLCQSLEQCKGGGDIAQARQIVAQMRLLLVRIAEQIHRGAT